MKRFLVWTVPGATLLAFIGLASLIGRLLGLSGRDLWILRGGLWLLGLVAALVVFFYMRAKRKAAPDEGPAEEDEIDTTISAAQARLTASAAAGKAKLGKLPVILFLGPSGSTKTTMVVQSGLEPELLAGEVYRGDVVAPTSAVNVWYAHRTVLLEAGGKIAGEPARWARVVRHIQPSRLAAVFSRGRQAPRVAVVCFGCDELLKPGAGEAVPAAARKLRARIQEMAQQLGIRLPVYVAFTKADRLPYFGDYVRSMSRDEAGEVLGTTLPAPPAGAAGSYAERETARLTGAFRGLFHSLALKRLRVLPRENQDEVKAGAYEFPREFRKVSDLAVQFLVELCKPSQLGASPFLRGFYFTGVRAVIVSDAASFEAPAPAPMSGAAPMDATSVFNPKMLQAAQQQAQAATPGVRKIPEWVFLRRLFGDVVFRDHAAMGVTGGGTRLNFMRRALLAAAAAFFVFVAGGFTVSYVNNRGLQGDAIEALRGVETLTGAQAGRPTDDALARMDRLREVAERVGRYERRGRPWRLRWGLYAGDAFHADVRRTYFERFNDLLWSSTREELLVWLHQLDETARYDEIYDALRAHLVTTSFSDSSTAEFLGPVLLRFSPAAQGADSTRLALLEAQFGFFGHELRYGSPFDDRPNESLIAQTLNVLRGLWDPDRVYQTLLAEAAGTQPPVRVPASAAGALTNDAVVSGAFTREGWVAVQRSLNDIDQIFDRESWVVGEQTLSAEQRAQLAREFRQRYAADYVDHWQRFLRAGSAVRAGAPGTAAALLARLGSNDSPVLEMLALVSRNTDSTAVSEEVARAFQPVHAVMPPEITDRYVVEANTPYVQALGGLQAALDQLDRATGPAREDARSEAESGVNQVKRAVQDLRLGFTVEEPGRTSGAEVERLLLSPIGTIERMIGGLQTADVNQKGASFCRPFNQLAARFPFSPRAAGAASMDDVIGMFQPGSGALWAFYEDGLQDLISPRGVERPGANPRPNPAFARFFQRAAAVSRTLFDENGNGPMLVFSFGPQASDQTMPEINVNIDGQARQFTPTRSRAETFEWNGARANRVRITARVGGAEQTLFDESGPWALFRVFHQADGWETLGGGRYNVRWRISTPPVTLVAEVGLGDVEPVLQRDYFERLRCVSQIAR